MKEKDVDDVEWRKKLKDVGWDYIKENPYNITFPSEIHIGRKSPTHRGAKWLHLWLKENGEEYGLKNGKVLEFSAGITSWCIAAALYPSREVIIENAKYCDIVKFKSMKDKDYFANVEMFSAWNQIPKDTYDLVMVDGSWGALLDFRQKANSSVIRKEAAEFSEQFHREGTIVIIHDYCNHGQYRKARNYLEDSPKYEFVSKIEIPKRGFGVFKRLNVGFK